MGGEGALICGRRTRPHASYILHLTSCILQLASYILHLTSCILHLTSYILHPRPVGWHELRRCRYMSMSMDVGDSTPAILWAGPAQAHAASHVRTNVRGPFRGRTHLRVGDLGAHAYPQPDVPPTAARLTSERVPRVALASTSGGMTPSVDLAHGVELS